MKIEDVNFRLIDKNVIAVQGDRLDWNYINRWCDRHGTREHLEKIRMSLPPIDETVS